MLEQTTYNSAMTSHLEAAAAVEAKVVSEVPDCINEVDLDFYKKLHNEASEAKKQLEELQKQIQQLESKAVYFSGSVSSFSEYIQMKYKLNKDDVVDAETGAIKRV